MSGLKALVRSERTQSRAFYTIIVIGMALGWGLGLMEVAQGRIFDVGDVEEQRDGLVSIVDVEVTNVSDSTQCVDEVRVYAQDREQSRLADVVARPVDGDAQLAPEETRVFRARIDTLTEEQYGEELREILAFVTEFEEC